MKTYSTQPDLTSGIGGDLSGASQPHKHVQLIPVEDDGPPVERLARAMKVDYPGMYEAL